MRVPDPGNGNPWRQVDWALFRVLILACLAGLGLE